MVVKEKVNNVLDWERDTHKIFVSEKQDYGNKKERKRCGKQRRTHSCLTPQRKIKRIYY